MFLLATYYTLLIYSKRAVYIDCCLFRDDLKKLTYLKYCIKESMRMFPPVAAYGRQLSEDRKFDKYTLCKGTWVFIHNYVIHNRPDVWENPQVTALYVLFI